MGWVDRAEWEGGVGGEGGAGCDGCPYGEPVRGKADGDFSGARAGVKCCAA